MNAGAPEPKCAKVINISIRTLKRWRKSSSQKIQDKRPTVIKAKPNNSLTDQEEMEILRVCNLPENASKPPAQIVVSLADQGIYHASESSFYRVLKKHKQVNHRGKARAPKARKKATHTASNSNEVWVWDITYLASNISGIYYKLYFIMDLFSRKIIAHEAWNEENAEHSKTLLRRVTLNENIIPGQSPVILHGDNGSPLKAGTVLSTMQQLGLTPSHSRPRVSNDNPHAEALFRTAKYHPTLPTGFNSLEEARIWSASFVEWYNNEHYHSALNFVNPAQKHSGEDIQVLSEREKLYEQAKAKDPSRWIQNKVRNWKPIEQTSLNPIDQRKVEKAAKKAA
ncbi:MAG: putative transposase [Rubritalea sp.]|jgi:putative transposase